MYLSVIEVKKKQLSNVVCEEKREKNMQYSKDVNTII